MTQYLLKNRILFKYLVILLIGFVLLGDLSQSARGQTVGPFSIWDGTAVPAVESENDPGAIEVGVKFQSDTDGVISGIRFYKGTSNTGTHIGNLWTDTGQLLASATFANETASGWQQVDFATPVQISANITYIASYHTEVGFYSLDDGYFSSVGVDNAPLRALADGENGGNGVYEYSQQSAFPTQSFNGSNYWVDVIFESGPDITAPTITTVSPGQGASDIFLDTNVTVTFNEAVDPATVNGDTFELRDGTNNVVATTVSYNAATNVVTLDPVFTLAISTFTATVKGGVTEPIVKDLAGNALAADYVWSFSTNTCDTVNNKIVCENSRPGNPASEWDITGAGDLSIQGFTTDISVNRGESVTFKIDTDAADYVLDIYRMGYYGGMGARKVASVQPSASLPQNQPACLEDVDTGLIDCGKWAVSASWPVPADATSGIYFAKVTRTDTGGASHIVFVVRDDDGGSEMLFQTSDTTWHAYNTYGGNSLYVGAPAGRAYKVSCNRPFTTRETTPEDFVFNAEYPMVRWLEANGYDVSYFSGVDADRFGQEILEHQVFLSVGHDEYWSAVQRANVETARDAGVNLAFFSGNEIFWKTRWEDSIDGSGSAYRTLVTYKETHDNAKTDPLPDVWTGTWRDPRFSPPADGGNPENGLTGTWFKVNIGTYAIEVPEADGKMRFWRNTSAANLNPGETATLSDFTLGYEWDEAPDNGFQPAGLIRMSKTSVNDAEVLLDYGSTFAIGSATHNIVLYRHSSGALVFGAGTVQWSWGLDGNHDRLISTPDERMQQATVNLFADMGVQPTTLQSGLVAATQTTDITPPTSSISSPAAGSTVPINSQIAISGTASDIDGVVGGVEVSVDGGATWHPTNGRENWAYAWTPDQAGVVTLMRRAVDDSGNLETASAITVTVSADPDSSPPTVNITNPTANQTVTGTISVEANATDIFGVVGVQFQVDGINFGAEDTVAPYSVSWNTMSLANGSHTVTAVARDAAGNSTTSTAVAVVVDNPVDNTPPTVANTVPADGASNVALNAIITATFSEAMDPATVNGSTFELRDGANNVIVATVAYDQASQTASLTPTNSLSDGTQYSVTIRGGATDPRVKDVAGNALGADYTWSFIAGSVPGGNCPCSIWDASVAPVNDSEIDAAAVEVGVKFQTEIDGYISGIRFYKGSLNTGTHIGNLWTSNGQLLGSAMFSGESASGWQQVDFGTPIFISANVTYVASYHTEVGFYAQDANYFAGSGVDNSPLHALADGVDGGNGVYQYGPSAFPALSEGAANYWVDVVFSAATGPDETAPVVTAASPADGAILVSPNANVTVTFNEPIDPATVNENTFELQDAASNAVPAVVSYDGASRQATLNPVDALPYSTTYSAIVRGGTQDPRVKDLSGNALASDQVWSFTTVAAPPIPPDDGPGGPILVISSSTNPFGRYYNEILRNEGFNLFLSTDISSITTTILNAYDVVVLGELSLTPGQVTMLSDWVNAGGNLIAMRPDKQLAGLLGLSYASATLDDGYLLVDTSTQPGSGIVSETMQYHGTADLYNTAGANTVATLYSNAATPVPGNAPAVTLNDVGANGGQAAAFSYDLARSIVYTRQGNPAWEGEERDGLLPIRSDDMFYGAAAGDPQADWVDLNKVAIPQADEQQRLLANLILHMNVDQMPLPRFWYFPNGHKAVVVMTGDDHGTGYTPDHFDAFEAMSPAGCSVSDWECIRGTSYIYPANPLTNVQAAAYSAAGHEIALHVDTGCAAYTPASLDANYSDQLAQFQTTYPSLPAPATNRTHCIVWSDWATQANVENQYGIRLDTTYYYFPGSWVNGQDGFFTGSGMPMRFAGLDGTMIDVYQAVTQLTDESGQSYPASANTLLDRAIGPEGYYGAFTANMHTDRAADDALAVVGSAQARGVPVVTARQMLAWLDGRNNSSFGSLDWSGSTLSFSITTASGANNLRAMLPTQTAGGPVTSINFNGAPISFTTEVIKGVEYAIFPALSGAYQASTTPLPPDTAAPTVSITQPVEGATVSGPVTVSADASDDVVVSGVQFQLNGADLGAEDSVAPYGINWDSTTVTNGVYQLSATARDAAGNSATSTAVNVTVDNIPDTTPPTIVSVSPFDGATNVATDSAISVNFDEAMDALTIDGNTIELRDASDSVVAAVVSYNAGTQTATLTPTNPLLGSSTYTVLVSGGAIDPRVKDIAGNALVNDVSWSFSTVAPSPYSSIWDTSTVPTVASENDANAIEVGVKFQSDVSGYIAGIRFYKGSNNTGTHLGNLWDSSGQLLASATFVNETATGWQEVIFGAPVAINANTTYVASYHTNLGFYSLDSGYFAAIGVINSPLQALADGLDGGNGVYTYGASAFPSNSFSASNYWVDVLFTTSWTPDTEAPVVAVTSPTNGQEVSGAVAISANGSDNVGVAGVQFQLDGVNLGTEDTAAPYSISWDTLTVANGTYVITAVARDAAGNTATSAAATVTVNNPIDTTPPAVTIVSPIDGAVDVAVDAAITATFSEGLDPATVGSTTFELRDGANNLVTATVSYDAVSQMATLTPGGALANGTVYSALIKTGVTDVAGNVLAGDYSWSFTTIAGPEANCPCSIWDVTATPTTAAAADPNGIEVGVKFQSDVAGYISGVRFYKGASNTGTHTGNLWDSSGALLASATFVNETDTGWQQVSFAAPVAIMANTTYIASYHAPNGYYAGDGTYFAASGVENLPLRALANGIDGGNGVYLYGAGGFPSDSFNATNYWVDVVFDTTIATDTTPPSVSVTDPIDGAEVSGTVPLTANASDDTGVTGVQFKLDGVDLGVEDVTAPYTISWDTSTVANGAHAITAVARDGAGNSTTSVVVNVTVTNDETPPTVTAVAPTADALDVTLDAIITATFSEGLDPATVNTSTFELRDGGNNLVAGVVSYDNASQTATLTPTGPLANGTVYNALATTGVTDVAGNALAGDYSWSFTTIAGPEANCPCSIWDEATVPTNPSVIDANAIELGVKFQSDVAGYISAVRFYKGTDNTGTHVGNLWDSSGALLATAVFVNETGTGWQQVNFVTPVAITAGTTYVASYHAPNGYYAADSNYFATNGVENLPLRALADGVDGGNGVYVYGASAFPTASFNAGNYWVDVVFDITIAPDVVPPTVTVTNPADGAEVSGTVALTADASDDIAVAGVQFMLDGANLGAEDTVPPYTISWDTLAAANGAYALTAVARDGAGKTTTSAVVNVTVTNDETPPTVTAVAPTADALDVAVDAIITATFSEGLDPATVNTSTFELRDGGNNLVAAVVSYDNASQTATLTPTGPLANGTVYNALATTGVTDVAGNALAGDYSWSFTTIAGPEANCPCSIWDVTATPTTAAAADPNGIEVGVKFQSDVAGYISGVRFYKGASNTGTHTGNLWDSSGALLATAVFVNETGTGWQQVNFVTPVAITAGTTYVASYHAPNGYYAADSNYFATNGVENLPLRALADGVDGGNGVYLYGAGGFPTNSYNAGNYWVDVVFTATITPDTTPPTVAVTDPADGAVVNGTVVVTADSSDDVAVAGVQFLLDGANLGVEDMVPPYNISWDTGTIANGPYQITAVARDGAGNSTTSVVVNVTVTNDVAAPTVSVTNPADGAEVSGTVALTADASDDIGVAGVQFLLDGMNLGAEDVTAPYTITWDTLMAANGAYAITAVARDGAGKTTTSAAVNVTVTNDVAAPAVSVTNPTEGAVVNGTVALTADASDDIGVAGVQFLLDGVNLGTEDVTAPYTIPWDTGTVANGAYVITAVARDGAGKTTTSAAVNVTVTNDVAAPAVSVTNPTEGAVVNGTVALTADASDDIGVAGVQFKLDGVDLGAEDVTAPYTIPWDTRTVANGAYAITAVARDDAGKTTTSAAVNVTVGNDVTAPAVTAVNPGDGTVDVAVDVAITATFNEGLDAATVGGSTFELRDEANNVVAATVSYDAVSKTATLAPDSPLSNSTVYSAMITTGVTDVAGNALASDYPWSFTTIAGSTIWDEAVIPANPSISDPNAIELGVKFQSDVDGYISGVRFYKGEGNTGTHIGNLWDSSGTLLATVMFVNETATGWQEVNFATPVAITAGTTYVASYHAPNGNYAADSNYFKQTGEENPPLRALADGIDGSNGVYLYGAGGFPTNSYKATNYWVDVVFGTTMTPDTLPPVIVVTNPNAGAVDVAINVAITAMFSEGLDPATVNSSTFELRDAANAIVAAAVSYDPASQTATLTPDSPLANGAVYSSLITTGATDVAGNALAGDYSWSFTTIAGAGDNCPCTIWDETATPTKASVNDPNAIELGVKFQSDIDGYISGIRFYKGVDNTGTHIGNLWDSSGALLASATFVNETGTGWQQVNFALPVAVTAGSTYVASYHAPNGSYAADNVYFRKDGVVNAPLQALADGVDGGNGVYLYGAGGFPANSYRSNNYWVDVVFKVNL